MDILEVFAFAKVTAYGVKSVLWTLYIVQCPNDWQAGYCSIHFFALSIQSKSITKHMIDNSNPLFKMNWQSKAPNGIQQSNSAIPCWQVFVAKMFKLKHIENEKAWQCLKLSLKIFLHRINSISSLKKKISTTISFI